MAFDVTKPADNQKIRLGPADIRDNFSAIITADDTFIPTAINFTKRGADPAVLADAVKVYVKADASTDPELFARDEDGNIIQLTEEGKLGGQSTGLWTNGISFDAGVTTIQKNQQIMAWGYFNGTTGATLTSVNMASCTRNSAGDYTVLTSAVFQNVNVCVMLTQLQISSDKGGSISVKTAVSYAANQITIPVEIKNRSGSSTDANFYIMVLGGQ